MVKEFDDYIADEREFLHDISNHLVVVSGMANFVMGKLEDVEGIDPKYIDRLGKVIKAGDKMTKAVIARREKIKSIQSD